MTASMSPTGRSTCRTDRPARSMRRDAFGNITHVFTADGPAAELVVHRRRQRRDAGHRRRAEGTDERFPPSLFLRATALTQPDATLIRRLRRSCARRFGDDVLGFLHRLHDANCNDDDDVRYRSDQHGHHRRNEAFALKRGVLPGLHSHLHRLRARSRRAARYVGGHFIAPTASSQQEAGHAWAEAYRAESRLGRLRSGQWDLHHRRPRPHRHRARLSRRGAGPRHALWRRQRNAGRRGHRSIRPAGEIRPDQQLLTVALPATTGGYCSNRRHGVTSASLEAGSWDGRNDLLLRHSRAGRPCHDRRHSHQRRPRQHLDLPQAARVLRKPGDRIMAIASAGNLAISQSVISILNEGIENPETGETRDAR